MKKALPAVVFGLLVSCPCLPAAPAPADKNDAPPKMDIPKNVQSILDEIGTPPIQASADEDRIPFGEFPAEIAAKYPAGGDETELRKAVRNVRVVLWAVSSAAPPTDLADKVAATRKSLRMDWSPLKDGYRQPTEENKFRQQVLNDEREIADLLAVLQDTLEALTAAGAKDRGRETRRWQANYDFTLARLQSQVILLLEYQSQLGQMRKELPPLAAGQNGWKLAPLQKVQGDPEGKRLARETNKLLNKIITDNPDTPWAILAGRLKDAPLGLEWQGVVNK